MATPNLKLEDYNLLILFNCCFTYIQAAVHIWRLTAGLISAEWAYHESQTESKRVLDRTLEANFLITYFQP